MDRPNSRVFLYWYCHVFQRTSRSYDSTDCNWNTPNFKKRIEDNSSLLKDISLGGFDKKQLIKFASENKLSVKNYKLTSLKQNDVFSQQKNFRPVEFFVPNDVCFLYSPNMLPSIRSSYLIIRIAS